MQVVEEIASGKFDGISTASKAYGIKGTRTVKLWLSKYGREDLIAKKTTISEVSELNENKQLKKRIRDLEKALADSYMSGLLSESYLEIACENMGIDLPGFKKKHVTNLSKDHPKEGGK